MTGLVLGIETSCDETAAALVDEEGHVRSSVVASQADLHARFGGVVPEIASRRHLELVSPVVADALAEAGATLDDVASLFLGPDPVEPPFLCLLASGGHTLLLDVQDRAGYTVLGTSIDDAAGEAFDKGARLLGLGYPGGREIDRLAREGDPDAFAFPVARLDGLDFSFSGVKTALLYAVRDLGGEAEARKADLAASYQRAIVRALVERTRAAAEREGHEQIAVVGGVAANSELRESLPGARFAPLRLCTDNAAMIASAGRYGSRLPYPRYLDLDAYASRA